MYKHWLALGILAAGWMAMAGPAWAAGPTITGLKDQTSISAFTIVGPFLFTVGDDATPADALTVTATSSDQNIVSDDAIVLGGSGATRSLTILRRSTPDGQATITVSVSDGTETTTKTFTLTFAPNVNYYLAEGATGPFFHTDILLSCPIPGSQGLNTTVNLTFLKEDGTTVQVPNKGCLQNQRQTISVEQIPGMESTSFSTVAEVIPLGVPVSVERTMRWGDSGYGAHTEKASLGLSKEWFFAEGSQGFFYTYFLLVNPQTTANTAHVTYLREGLPPVTRDYPMPPLSRRTIGAIDDSALVNTSFGAHVTFDQPGMAERSMYFGQNPLFSGGTAAAGVNEPSKRWLLAEGATGSFFTTFVLIANPGTEDAHATLTYLPASGQPIVKQVLIPAGRRVTRNVAIEDTALASTAVGVTVDADQPILVERSQYWPGSPATWYESHGSFGVTDAASYWGLAEGGVGGPTNEQTYILLANPGTRPADVTITFAEEIPLDAQTQEAYKPVVKHFTVPPTSRLNVSAYGPGSDVPELVGTETASKTFGAKIQSTESIVVERSFYYDADGITWAAGTNATGTRFPVAPLTAAVSPDQVNIPTGVTASVLGAVGFAAQDANVGGRPFKWTMLKRPAGSQSTLDNDTVASPAFPIDVAGDYLLQFVVGRADETSAPETVLVTTERPPTDLSVTATDPNASEVGPDPGTFTFTRSGGDLTKPLTVTFVYDSGGLGNVIPGIDFTDDAHDVPTPGFAGDTRKVIIPANQTTATVTITPRADMQAEGPESVQIHIVPNRAFFVTSGVAIITIADAP